ncbi:MAG: DUF4270 family protein [Crocinitomicaceae bacterium]|nr:DUF4270 family protein [Crocinitomicaceae bacterium]
MKLLVSYLVVFVLLLVSCKKEVSSIGVGALSAKDPLLQGVDTFTLHTETKQYDSLISSNPSYLLIGSSVDPVFGKTNASFYSQVRLTSFKPNFGALANITIDSVVLSMRYSDYYGTLTDQSFEVYQLTEGLSSTSTYYTYSTLANNGIDLVAEGKNILSPKSLNYYFVDGNKDTIRDQFRVNLKKTLGDLLISEAVNNASSYESVEAFNTWFKGLHIKVNNLSQNKGEGAIFTLAIAPQLIVYYSVLGVAKKYTYELNANGVRFNSLKYDITGFDLEKGMQSNNTQEFYAQANNVRSTISFPYINSISKNSIVHSAQLVLPYNSIDSKHYFLSNEISIAIPTSATDPSLRVLGYATIDTLNKRYVIDIRDHMQSVVTLKRLNLGMVIAPKFFSTSAERIRFYNEFSELKPKLYIKYSSY